MNETIKDILTNLETERTIKIIFAVESGSRTWDFASRDSDYDIRFIYARPLVDYLAINACNLKDNINFEDGLLDFAGWDLRKALNLYRKSNPAIMEWLLSDIVYVDRFGLARHLFDLRVEGGYWNEKASQYHYYHMANNNWRRYLENGSTVNHKKYLYVIRPLLAVLWSDHYHTPPPLNITKLINHMTTGKIRHEMTTLVGMKRRGAELGGIKKNHLLDGWIQGVLDSFENGFSGEPVKKNSDELTALFLSTMGVAWNVPMNHEGMYGETNG